MFTLQNSMGLYLMSMGPSRHDYSFTKDKELALTFSDEKDAENKQTKLRIYNLKIVEIENTAVKQ